MILLEVLTLIEFVWKCYLQIVNDTNMHALHSIGWLLILFAFSCTCHNCRYDNCSYGNYCSLFMVIYMEGGQMYGSHETGLIQVTILITSFSSTFVMLPILVGNLFHILKVKWTIWPQSIVSQNFIFLNFIISTGTCLDISLQQCNFQKKS